MNRNIIRIMIICVGLLTEVILPTYAVTVRIKDIVNVEGVRSNDLIGYGLVVGLNGTGDSIRNIPYTEEALSSILESLGTNLAGEVFRPKNVAAVMVTGSLPAFSKMGNKIDIVVSALGDAKSLYGGTLIMTPLIGADGKTYAVAQGSVVAGGYSAKAKGTSLTVGVPTVATIAAGAVVENEVTYNFNALKTIQLSLKSNVDFTTAERIQTRINSFVGQDIAQLTDPATISLTVLPAYANKVSNFIANIENLEVEPDNIAKVLIDQKTGTVVIGNDVKLSTIAIAQGNLKIKITQNNSVSQPDPFSEGSTVGFSNATIDSGVTQNAKLGMIEENVTLEELVNSLNKFGLDPKDLIDVLVAIYESGSLHAELVIR